MISTFGQTRNRMIYLLEEILLRNIMLSNYKYKKLINYLIIIANYLLLLVIYINYIPKKIMDKNLIQKICVCNWFQSKEIY